MVLRDVERPETSPLMAPAHPPPSLTRRGPVEGTLATSHFRDVAARPECYAPQWGAVLILPAPIGCSAGFKTSPRSALERTITFRGDVWLSLSRVSQVL